MRNNEEQKIPLERGKFVILLLKAIQDDPKVFRDAVKYFKQNLLTTIEHESFDDPEEREKYASMLQSLDNIAYPAKLFKRKDIDIALDEAIDYLEARFISVNTTRAGNE